MARPAQPEKRRDLAMQAIEVMQAEGVDIPMSRLAEAMGIKRPTLLYHFPTRGHIAEMALAAVLTEQAIFVLARIEEHEHPIDRLYAQVRAVHEFHDGREAKLLFLAQAIATGAARMAEILDVGNQVFEMHRQDAANRIRAGIEEGTVMPCDADAVVCLVRSVIDGLMVQRVMTGLDLGPIHELLWTQLLRPLKA